jgi:hypothetical protein
MARKTSNTNTASGADEDIDLEDPTAEVNEEEEELPAFEDALDEDLEEVPDKVEPSAESAALFSLPNADDTEHGLSEFGESKSDEDEDEDKDDVPVPSTQNAFAKSFVDSEPKADKLEVITGSGGKLTFEIGFNPGNFEEFAQVREGNFIYTAKRRLVATFTPAKNAK